VSIEGGSQAPAAWSLRLVDRQILHVVQIKSMVNLFFIHQFNNEMLLVMTEEFGFMSYEDSLLG